MNHIYKSFFTAKYFIKDINFKLLSFTNENKISSTIQKHNMFYKTHLCVIVAVNSTVTSLVSCYISRDALKKKIEKKSQINKVKNTVLLFVSLQKQIDKNDTNLLWSER